MSALVTSAKLMAAGYRTGTIQFATSYIDPRDAIRIDNQMISMSDYQAIEDCICHWQDKVESQQNSELSPRFELLTSFEKTTIVALCWFMLQSVDIAIIEVGVGGRRDATNIFDVEFSALPSLVIDDETKASWSPVDRSSSSKAPTLSPEQPHSVVQCFVSISLDHVGLIGNTIEEIAYEKAGIIRKDATVVIEENNKNWWQGQ